LPFDTGFVTDDDLRAVGVPDIGSVRRQIGHPLLVFEAASREGDSALDWLLALYAGAANGWGRSVFWAEDAGAARWLMSMYAAR